MDLLSLGPEIVASAACSDSSDCSRMCSRPHGTMRFGSTAKVLAKCKLKYYRISECMVSCINMMCLLGALHVTTKHCIIALE